MTERWRFRSRREAGRAVADQLGGYAGRPDVLVVGIPRGGLAVASEIARALGAPLDVFAVRKLGVPGHEELAMGAIATGGVVVRNDEVVEGLGISDGLIETVVARERRKLQRREEAYRGNRAPLEVAGRTVIVVDDGLATGSTMRAAVRALRARGPARIVVAVPVAPPDTCASLRSEADEVVCPLMPEPFQAVGLWYDAFPQLEDEEVREILEQARPGGEP
jgi:predicted phosphoribosyltransferase